MKKKVLSLLLAGVMTFSLAVTANAAEETAQDLDGDIVILHTNDVHGAISGYAKVAALKDAYEARGAYVLLMDAGDFIQGDPTVSPSEGATAVELMNLAGYDVASMGNHEFDYGYQNLKDLEADADFTIVDANVLYNGQVAFEDNVVFTAPDGTFYHHILDPRTGRPVETDVAGVTVICEKSIDAEGFSTTLLALGLERGLALARRHPEILQAFFIAPDGTITNAR